MVGKKVRRGVAVWPVGVNVIKSDLYARLRLKAPTESEIAASGYPDGFIHFPMLDEGYLKQLTAETLVVTTTRAGRQKSEWIKSYPQNEALDTFVYNIAAWHAVGANRWSEQRWGQLERHVG